MRTTEIRLYLETMPVLVDNTKLLDMCLEAVQPIRYMLDSDDNFMRPTSSQLRSIGAFMSEYLGDYKKRIPVLQAITGNPLYTSTKLMTLGVVSILIDVLTDKNEDGHFVPSDWFSDVVPGIEHLIELQGGTCPPQFWREGIIGTEY